MGDLVKKPKHKNNETNASFSLTTKVSEFKANVSTSKCPSFKGGFRIIIQTVLTPQR
jgi:hypothetical protein